MLKRLANYAIREFEEEVKKKVRAPLDPEEIQEQSEEQKPTKKRKVSGKVKQAKVIRQQDKVDPITGKGKSKGYGFLELYEHADALRLLRWANNNTDLAHLWAKWWKEEVAGLVENAPSSVKDANKDGVKDSPDARMQRLKDELKKDGSGRWTTKGSLIVEFSLENIQVTQRRKSREEETVGFRVFH
jgi:nucleolar protein 4